jgi:hypothetical protein
MASSEFVFGMYQGRPIDEVVQLRPWYVKWAYENVVAPVMRGGVSEEQYQAALARMPGRASCMKRDREPRRQDVARPKKQAKRFGAFLRLYGPLKARTHAVLVLGHAPRHDTPRGFLDELAEERRLDAICRGMRYASVELQAKIAERTT